MNAADLQVNAPLALPPKGEEGLTVKIWRAERV